MVPSLTIAFLIISAFITIVLPVIVAIFIWQKGHTKWWVFLAGMVGFVVTQMILRIPLMNLYFAKQAWFLAFSAHTVPFYLFNAFTAGLFETAGRLLVFLVIIRLRRNYEDGLLAGLGHGTIESILLAGSVMLSYLSYALMINAGTFDTLVASQATDAASIDAMNNVYTLLTGSATIDYLASAVERLMAITLHIALSILVLEGIERKHIWPYALTALFYHMVVDFTVPLFALKTGYMWLSELLLFAFTIPLIIYIVKAKQRFADIAAARPREAEAVTE